MEPVLDFNGKAAILALAVAAAGLVLALFVVDTLRHDPKTFVAIVVLVGLAVVLDFAWKSAQASKEAGP